MNKHQNLKKLDYQRTRRGADAKVVFVEESRKSKAGVKYIVYKEVMQKN